jgi:hypothetical protein
MTKPHVLAAWTGGNDVADLDFLVRHNHAVNQELNHLAFLLKGRGRQPLLDALTERRDVRCQLRELEVPVTLRRQVLDLRLQRLLLVVQLAPAALILGQRDYALEIRLPQALKLLGQAMVPCAQIVAARVEFLGQPGATLRAPRPRQS